jgi:hypothetical protein
MKFLFFIAFVLTSNLFAAEFKIQKTLTNSKLQSLKSDFSELMKTSSGYKGEVKSFKIELREDDETIEAVIEKMIFNMRSKDKYSTPDNVDIKKIKKGDEQSVFEAIVAKLSNESFKMRSLNFQFELVKPTRQLVYFDSYDSNTFGSCEDLVIFDIKNQEILILGACYAE